MTTSKQFQRLLEAPEGGRVEFKSATGGYHFEELIKYCVALANEGGGTIVLGATDKRPRKVVGTGAFAEPGRTEAGLYEQLRQRIPVEEYHHESRRVLLVHVPARLPGTAWQYKGAFWMRAGDALLPMTDDQLRLIHNETGPDFTAEVCSGATLDGLDMAAIEMFRRLWQRKSPNTDVASRPVERLLADAELVVDGQVTYAALILLGTREALGRCLGHSEIVFEYRSTEAPGPASDRHELRQGAVIALDEVWRLISLRNDMQHFQQGLFVWDIPTFNESAVREALLNAVSHRDYRSGGSVFVRQFPRRLEVVSPGGFPAGITPENVLWQQNPRNRRVAEALGKCGLVERAGQGFDLIYRECIRQSRPMPDFTRTDAHSVWVTFHGEVQDPEFLRFLEEIGQERMSAFTIDDFLVVDAAHREQPVAGHLIPRVEHLLEQGVIERVGRGRGSRLLLSRRFYRKIGKGGAYTRKRGLDRETNKALLLKHIIGSGTGGVPFAELAQVLPAATRSTIQRLLRELRDDGQIELRGERKGARWHPLSGQKPVKHKRSKSKRSK